jgi:hypothetical protein
MVEYVKNVNIRSGEKEPGAKWGMFFHPMHLFLKRITSSCNLSMEGKEVQ